MSKAFSGGIRIKKRQITEELQSEVSFSSVEYTLSTRATLTVGEGQTVSRGAVLCHSDRENAATVCGVSGRVNTISENDDGSIRVTVSAEELDSYSVAPAPVSPLDKPLKDCTSEELAEMLLEKGVRPISLGAKSPKLLTVNCGGSQTDGLSPSLLKLYPKEIVGGAKILMKLYGVRKCIFAIPDTALSSAQRVEERLPSGSSFIRIVIYKDKYPALPNLIIRATSGIEINARKRPENAGYPVVDPALCLQVYRALAEGEYIYGDYLFITDTDGAARLCAVPYGAKISEALSVPDGFVTVTGEKILASKTDSDTVMTYGMRSVVTVRDKTYPARERGDCMGCGRCDSVCPAMISPRSLYSRLVKGRSTRNQRDELLSCFECGCCSAVCPSRLPLYETILSGREIALSQPDVTEDVAEEEFADTVAEAENVPCTEAAEEISEESAEEITEETTEEAEDNSDNADEPFDIVGKSEQTDTQEAEAVDLNEIFKEDGENE